MAKLLKHLTADFNSGLDLRVVGSGPALSSVYAGHGAYWGKKKKKSGTENK